MTESLLYRNQFIDLLGKSMDWFLYDRDFRHERVDSCNDKHFTRRDYQKLLNNRYLLVKNQQWKIKNKVYNMFKINDRSTRTTSQLIAQDLY